MANTPGAHSAPEPDYSSEALVYVSRVRNATRQVTEPGPEHDMEATLRNVREAAIFDADVPVHSSRPELQAVKSGVKKLSSWYMRYLATQLNSFAAALLDWADLMARRAQDVEADVDGLSARVEALEERLDHLEGRHLPAPAPGPDQAAGGAPAGDDRPPGGAPAGDDRPPGGAPGAGSRSPAPRQSQHRPAGKGQASRRAPRNH
jgi:hypothetical protein